jgi:nicotinate-nucleotide adenylyltransferase
VRIGVFGGEFDPPHVGHLVVAQEARHVLALDQLLVVPVGVPPHRSASPTPPLLRHEMARIAFEHEADTEVSTLEIDRTGPSFTVDTLQELSGPEVELALVMGADQYAALHRWHDHERIRDLATVAVARRPGAAAPAGADVVLDSPLVRRPSSGSGSRPAGR